MSLLTELSGANMSDVDLAYKILKEKRQPEYYKSLIEEVLAKTIIIWLLPKIWLPFTLKSI